MYVLIFIIEFIVVITGLLCVRKDGPVLLVLLLLINTASVLNDNLLATHAGQWWGVSGNVLYNLFSLAEISVWLFIFTCLHYYSRTLVRLIRMSWCFIMLYSLAELFIFHSLKEFHVQSYMCFSVVSVVCSLIYIRRVIVSDFHRLSGDPYFWICSAAVCFNCTFFLNLYTMIDPGYWQEADAGKIFHLLQNSAVIIYNLFICTAFISYYYRSTKSGRLTLS